MRYLGKYGEYPDVTIWDVLGDIDEEARTEKRLASYTKRGQTAPRVTIISRTMSTYCPVGETHHLVITQLGTIWYREHSALGTTFHARCKRCGEEDTWAYGETKVNDTGGLNHD